VLIEKTKNYGEDFDFFDTLLGKMGFLSEEKEFLKMLFIDMKLSI
jgi:hypothetical protein